MKYVKSFLYYCIYLFVVQNVSVVFYLGGFFRIVGVSGWLERQSDSVLCELLCLQQVVSYKK